MKISDTCEENICKNVELPNDDWPHQLGKEIYNFFGEMRNFFYQFCIVSITCLVSIEFCPNCNQTSDK